MAATNALELGVDIGSLDVTLHLGFQGSVASLWQQSGRAGRRKQGAMSVYVAFDGPLDQYFMADPNRLFQRSIESAQVPLRLPAVLEYLRTIAHPRIVLVLQLLSSSVSSTCCLDILIPGLLSSWPV